MNKSNQKKSLRDKVKEDIDRFLTDPKHMWFNERDLQMHLALFLKENKDYNVDVEYHIPVDFIKGEYPWSTKTISIDIMVSKGEEYVPIELKYKLKKLQNSVEITRCGKQCMKYDIVCDQGARDHGCYDFWKDVKRIELLKKNFQNVKGGIAILVTNDIGYKKMPKENVNYYNFRLNEQGGNRQSVTGELNWVIPGSKIVNKKKYSSFTLCGKYSTKWKQIAIKEDFLTETDKEFYCCITLV